MDIDDERYRNIEKLERVAIELNRAYEAGIVGSNQSQKLKKILQEGKQIISAIGNKKTYLSMEVEALIVYAEELEKYGPSGWDPWLRSEAKPILEGLADRKGKVEFQLASTIVLAKRLHVATTRQKRASAFSEQLILWVIGIVVFVAWVLSQQSNQ